MRISTGEDDLRLNERICPVIGKNSNRAIGSSSCDDHLLATRPTVGWRSPQAGSESKLDRVLGDASRRVPDFAIALAGANLLSGDGKVDPSSQLASPMKTLSSSDVLSGFLPPISSNTSPQLGHLILCDPTRTRQYRRRQGEDIHRELWGFPGAGAVPDSSSL